MNKLTRIAAVVAVLSLPFAVQAESDVNTLAGPNSTASARLDFTVVIPRVLFLQVGTGSNFADNGTIDLLTFTVPAASLGNGTDVAATPAAGAVTVRVFGNNGDIGLTSTTTGPMTNAAGDTLPWSEILVTSAASGAPAAGYLGAAIPHPTIPAAAGTSASFNVAVNSGPKVVRAEGVWTFAYDNSAAYAAGTYGTSANNGRIVYTATLP